MQTRTTRELQRCRLSCAILSTFLMSGAVFAQDGGNKNDDTTADQATTDTGSQKTLDRIEVVGSRIKRAELEGPAPITVISRSDIEKEGYQTVGEMLQTLTQNTTSSFTGALATNSFTPNAQVVNLRDLGPGYTLTLINGRRPAQYPQPFNRDYNVVNVAAIPSSIVDRIEVLTGGASAIYGSDAVAGVVNVVLRKNYDGNNLAMTVGTTAGGGGDSVDLQYTGGSTGDRWSEVHAFEYRNDEPVYASQRKFLADTRNGPLGRDNTFPSLALGVLGFNGVSTTSSVYYPGQQVCDRFGYTSHTFPGWGTYCGSFTQPASRTISNKNETLSAYGYGTFDATDKLQVFGSARAYRSKAAAGNGTEFWATQGDQFLQTPTGNALQAYYDPQFSQPVFLQRIFNPSEVGGADAVTTRFTETSFDLMAGVRGSIADRFDWEAMAAYGRYEYEANLPRLLSKSMQDYFLGSRLGYQTVGGIAYPIYRLDLNRWNTPITPDQYRAFTTHVINRGTTTSSLLNFSVSGDLFDMPAGPLGFAAVVEGERQTTDLRSDPRTDPLRPLDGQTVYNLVSSGRTVGKRNHYALGTEFRVPLFAQLTAQVAGRYDKYDDITAVDDAVSKMFGLEWRPTQSLLIRGSYSTSFRAPDMQLVFAQGAASYSAVLDEYACRAGVGVASGHGPRTTAACVSALGDPTIYSTQTAIAGNPKLREESGKSYGAGFVWDIMNDMSLSLDYYRIKLMDQSLQLSAATLLQDEANCRLGQYRDGSAFPNGVGSSFCQNVFSLVNRQGGTATGAIQRINSAYINAALSDTSGIDATFRYKLKTDQLGDFRFDLGYSLVLTNKYKEFASDALVDYRDVPQYNSRSRVRGSVGWSRGDWQTEVAGIRYGSSTSDAGVDGTNAAGAHYSDRLAPYMLYNWTIGRRFNDRVNATFTVENVFNNLRREDSSNVVYPFFSSQVGADPLGRRFYLNISYKF